MHNTHERAKDAQRSPDDAENERSQTLLFLEAGLVFNRLGQ